MALDTIAQAEIIDAVNTAKENDTQLTEQDRNNTEVATSLKKLALIYDHEWDSNNIEWRNIVLVAITQAALELWEDPQNIADLIFGEGKLSMNTYLWDAFKNADEIDTKLLAMLWVRDLTDIKILSYPIDGIKIDCITWILPNWKQYYTFITNGYFNDMIHYASDFNAVVDIARRKIFGKEMMVDNTTDIDAGSKTTNTNPDTKTLNVWTIQTTDEKWEKIELNFDELIKKLKNTSDKAWAIEQFKNLMHLENPERSEILSRVFQAIIENKQLNLQSEDIYTLFNVLADAHIDVSNVHLDTNTIQNFVDYVWDIKDGIEARKVFNVFKLTLNPQSQKDFETALWEKIDTARADLLGKIKELPWVGQNITWEQVASVVWYQSENKVKADTADKAGIPEKYLQNWDGRWALSEELLEMFGYPNYMYLFLENE